MHCSAVRVSWDPSLYPRWKLPDFDPTALYRSEDYTISQVRLRNSFRPFPLRAMLCSPSLAVGLFYNHVSQCSWFIPTQGRGVHAHVQRSHYSCPVEEVFGKEQGHAYVSLSKGYTPTHTGLWLLMVTRVSSNGSLSGFCSNSVFSLSEGVIPRSVAIVVSS